MAKESHVCPRDVRDDRRRTVKKRLEVPELEDAGDLRRDIKALPGWRWTGLTVMHRVHHEAADVPLELGEHLLHVLVSGLAELLNLENRKSYVQRWSPPYTWVLSLKAAAAVSFTSSNRLHYLTVKKEAILHTLCFHGRLQGLDWGTFRVVGDWSKLHETERQRLVCPRLWGGGAKGSWGRSDREAEKLPRSQPNLPSSPLCDCTAWEPGAGL